MMKGMTKNEYQNQYYPHLDYINKELRRINYLSKRLDIFDFAVQHKDCPEHIHECEINGHKYVVHSHFVGTKDIDKVLEDIAVNKAMSDVLYGENILKGTDTKDKNIA